MKIYDFKEQFDRGKFFEAQVDEFLDKELGMEVSEVPREDERRGIDRIATSRVTNVVMTLEIKADERGGDTGNAFIETVSIERNGVVEKYGWIKTSQAQVLAYYLPTMGRLFLVDMPLLKRHFSAREDDYREVPIRNRTYTGYGKVMPLTELAELAFYRAVLDPIEFDKG